MVSEGTAIWVGTQLGIVTVEGSPRVDHGSEEEMGLRGVWKNLLRTIRIALH